MDLLTKLKAKVNFEKHILETPNASISIHISKPQIKNNLSQISLKPKTEEIVKIPVAQDIHEGYLKHYSFPENISIPDSIVRIENKNAIVALTNPNDNPVVLNIHEPFQVEEVDSVARTVQPKVSKEEDNKLKANLKNLRLEHLNPEEKKAIHQLCLQYRDIFHCEDFPLTFTNEIKHGIRLKDEAPVYTKSYRYPQVLKQEVQQQVSKLLEQGIIRHSISPWNSPVWIVPKKEDASKKKKWRMVIDYRKLNEKTIEDKYPIPNITDILEKLGKCQYFTTLDLSSGFHQIEMEEKDIEKNSVQHRTWTL